MNPINIAKSAIRITTNFAKNRVKDARNWFTQKSLNSISGGKLVKKYGGPQPLSLRSKNITESFKIRKEGRPVGSAKRPFLSWRAPNLYKAAKATLPFATVALGGLSMLSVGMMRGATSQARDILYQRYMQDARYSRNMLTNATRTGAGLGYRFDKYNSVAGLSNAMSARRHG